MLNENLGFIKTSKGFRDIVGYYFSQWFDEPFTVDMLNRTHCRNYKYVSGNDFADQNHVDYYFTDEPRTFCCTVDSKTYSHNFKFTGANKDKNGEYADVLTIGEFAYYSPNTSYFSVVYKDKVYMVLRTDMINPNIINPCMITNESKGQNNQQQTLYHFKMEDVMRTPNMFSCDIPKEMQNCYEEAYKLYYACKNDVYWFRKQNPGVDCKVYMYKRCEQMRQALIPIIQKFNKIYDEIPKINLDDTLSEIKSIINW